jgi:glycosyltransferase involved in cell wall biosynthesis
VSDPVQHRPRFTVVLAAYNEERLVGDAIRSVLAQTVEDFELIVVDDGSTDDTARVVESFMGDPRIKLLRQENRGLAASLNAGATAGSAPYIGLIDADDLWMPRYLELMSTTLEASPKAGFTYTDSWRLDMATGRFRRQSYSQQMSMPEPPPADPYVMALSLLKGNWIVGLPLMRREVFEALGGFEESLAACEDYDLWLRFLAHGHPALRTDGRLVIQRNRPGSMSKNPASMYRNLREVYRRAAEEMPFPESVKLEAYAALQEAARAESVYTSAGLKTRLAIGARLKAGAIARTILRNRIWLRDTPPDVAAAFPEMTWRKPG